MNEEERQREHNYQMQKINAYVDRQARGDPELDERGDPLYRNYEHPGENDEYDEEALKNASKTYKAQMKKGFTKEKKEGKLINRNTKVFNLIDSSKQDSMGFLEQKKPQENVNRLSVILLNKGKNEKANDHNSSPRDFDVRRDPNKETFESPSKKKFSRITLAMIASKGPNCEDRVITKVMRGEEAGGVVDLGINQLKPKKFEVKKFGGEKKTKDKAKGTFNPKLRAKSAKIIQGWWRNILKSFEGLEDKVVKLQSVWRGYWYRKYLYDIIYYTYMTKAFVEKVNNPIRDNLRKIIFNMLQERFAHKYWIRKNLRNIIAIQRKMQQFLRLVRNKKKRSCLAIEKIYLRKLMFGFKRIQRFSENNENIAKKRARNVQNFLKKVNLYFRIRVFHELLWRVYVCPINEMRERILNKTLKLNFHSRHKYWMRKYFMLWFKKAMATNDKYKCLSATVIKNNILKPLWEGLIGRLRKFPPKGFKEKLLRRFVKDADHFTVALLRHFFSFWKVTSHKMGVKEFKDEIGQKFLFRTAKRREFLDKSRYFRRWRQYCFQVNNITPFIDGLPLLKRHVLRKAFNGSMPKLLNTDQGVKGRVLKGMMFSGPKFRLNLIRRYLEKWKKVTAHLGKLEASCLFLKSFKRGHNSKIINRLITARFNDWRRKANMLKFLQQLNQEEKLAQQDKASMALADALLKHSRKKLYPTVHNKVKHYLLDVIRSRAVKELFKRFKFLAKICLRKYITKWKQRAGKIEKQEATAKMCSSLMKNFANGLRIKRLFIYFNKWHRNLPKHTLFDIQQGLKTLEIGLQHKNIKKIIKAFNLKMDKENTEEAMKKALGFSGKFLKKKWKDFFFVWKKNAELLKIKAAEHLMASKFMSKFLGGYVKRILLIKFKQWHSKKPARLTLHQLFMRNKGMCQAVDKFAKKRLDEVRSTFWKKLKNTNGNQILIKAYQKLLDFAINGKKIKKKHAFFKWKDRCRDLELKDLRHQLMRMTVNQELFKNKSKRLASFFHRWRNQIQLLEMNDLKGHFLNIYAGLEKIDQLKMRKYIDFFIRLKRLMNFDTRGKVIHLICKRLNKPRYNLSYAIEKWRRRAFSMQRDAELHKLSRKVCAAYTKKLTKRVERDALLKRFRKWRYVQFFASHVLPDIAKGFPMLKSFLRKKFLGKPFTSILRSKNYKSLFNKMLPVGSKLQKRWRRNHLEKCFKMWILQKDRAKANDMRAMLFEKTNGKYAMKIRLQRLARWFRKWKQNSYKQPLDFEKASNALKKIELCLKGRYVKGLLFRAKYKALENDKKKGLNAFVKQNKGFRKLALKYRFKQWWKHMLVCDDKSKPRVMRIIKRYLVENYVIGPKEKFFRKWLRALYFKPVDGKNLIKAIQHLKVYLLKKTLRPLNAFKKIGAHRSPYFMEKSIVDKLLPNYKNLSKRYLRNHLLKWRTVSEKLAIFGVKLKLMNSLYGKTQRAILLRNTRKYFRRWADKENKKKDLDLRAVIKFNNDIFGFCARKLLKGFIPQMKDFSVKRFLKASLLKQTKFHRRALEPFFKRWKNIYEVLKSKEMKQGFTGRILQKTGRFLHNRMFTDIVRRRLRLWSKNAEKLKENEKNNTPLFCKLIRAKNKKLNFPTFLEKLKRAAMDSLRKRFSMGLLKKSGLCKKRTLHMYFKKWMKKVTDLQLKDVKLSLFKNHMKLSETQRRKTSLLRAFEKWKKKEVEVTIQNRTAIHVAKSTLKRLLTRRPWKLIKKKVSMMNLKVPTGCSMSQALVRFNPNICKSIALRNYLQRRFWRRWRSKAQHEKTKELEAQMFKKLFMPNLKNCGKLAMRRVYRMWADKTQQITTLEARQNMQLHLMKNMYSNNTRLCMKRYLSKWYRFLQDFYKRLNKITLGFEKLRYRLKRPIFRTLHDKILFKGAFDKTPIAKKILLNWLRRTEKGKLTWAFNQWNKQIAEIKSLLLKHRIAKNIFKKLNLSQEMKDKNKMVEMFLHWRIFSSRKKFDFLSYVRIGHELLGKGMRKNLNRPFFDNLNQLSKKVKFVRDLQKLVNRYDVEKKSDQLKSKFEQWRDKVKKINDFLDKTMRDVCKNYTDGPLRNSRITEPISSLLDYAKTSKKLKDASANTINKFLKKGLAKSFKELAKDRLIKLHFIMDTIANKENGQVKLHLIKWLFQANMISLSTSIKTIQNYLRKKIQDVGQRRGVINNAFEQVNKHIDRKAFEAIKDFSRKKRIIQLLLRNMKDIPEELKHKFLKKYLKIWYADLIGAQNKTAGDLINSMCRRYFAVKLKKKLLGRRMKMNKVILKLVGKTMDKQKIYLLMWRLNSRQMAVKDGANTILKFLGQKLNNLKTIRSILGLRHMLRLYGWKQVKNSMKLCSKVNKDRANILYDNLRKIYYDRPFELIKNTSKWKTRLAKLGDTLPKIFRSMKMYYLPFYLKRWKVKGEAIYLDKLIRIQNMIRSKLIILRKKAEIRKSFLATKMLAKLTNDENIQKKIYLNFWSTRAKMLSFVKAQNMISSIWKGNTSRKNADKQRKGMNLKRVFRRLFCKSLNRDMIRAFDNMEKMNSTLNKMKNKFEKRYVANNLLDYGNNTIRNMLLFKLTKNINYNNYYSILQRAFFKFRRNTDNVHKSVLLLQTNYRSLLARKALQLKRRCRDLLLKKLKKYCQSDEDKKRVFLLRWNNYCTMNDIIKNTNKIQSFLRRRVENNRRQKLKDFFENLGKLKAGILLHNAGKVNNLYSSVCCGPYQKFWSNLKYHLILKKLLMFLLKRFSNIDDELKGLLLKKYLSLWQVRKNKINIKRAGDAMMVQKLIRGWLARLKNLPNLKKKKILEHIRVRFSNTMDLKFQSYFLYWMKLCKLMNTFEAARKIQAYMKKIKLKSKDIKNKEGQDNVSKASEIIQKCFDKKHLNSAFKEVKNKADFEFYRRLARKLIQRGTDLEKWSFKRFGDYMVTVNNCAGFIQKQFKNYMFGKRIGKVLYKIKRLRWLMKMMSDRDMRFKHKAIIEWQKRAHAIKLNTNAQDLQLFIKRSLLKYRKQQKRLAREKFRKFTILNVFLKGKLKPYAKHYSNYNRFIKAYPLVMKYIFKKFKYRCNHYDKLMNCSAIYNIRNKIIKRIMRKKFLSWLHKAKMISTIKAVNLLNRNILLWIRRTKKKKLKKNMDNILKNLAIKHSDKYRFYFLKWWFVMKKTKVDEGAIELTKFTRKHLLRNRAMKKWRLWSDKMSKYEQKFDLSDILLAAKRLKHLNNMFTQYREHIMVEGWKEFIHRMKVIKIIKLLKLLFGNYEKRVENLTKLRRLRVWKYKMRKLVERDQALDKMVNKVNHRRVCTASQYWGDLLIYKKMISLIKVIRSKYAFHMLKEKWQHKIRVSKFFELLKKADLETLNENKDYSIKRMMNVYVCNSIKSFTTRLHNIYKEQYLPRHKRAFIKRLKQLYFSNSLFEYENQHKERSNLIPPKHITFEAMSYSLDDTPKEKAQQSDADGLAGSVLFGVLIDLLRKRLRWGWVAIFTRVKASKFYERFKNYCQIKLPKKNFFNNYRRKYIDILERPVNMRKIKGLIRLWLLRFKFFEEESMDQLAKRLKLRYYLKICLMHADIGKMKSQKKYLRKWHYKVTVKNVAKKKMLMLYQNMHLQFLQMAHSMFGEDNNDGLFDEMGVLNEKFGAFTNEDHSSDHYKKKYCKDVVRRYVFKDEQEEKHQQDKEVDEKKNNPIVEQEVNTVKDKKPEKKSEKKK